MKTKPNDIVEYYARLENFDWLYEYSDDFDLWKQRSRQHRELAEDSSLSDRHWRLYRAFHKHHFQGFTKPNLNDYLMTMGGLGIDIDV